MLKELEAREPDRHVAFTAIDQLKDAVDIQQFYQEYCELEGTEIANSNIGYILGYYGRDTMKRWFEALPDVSHPFFGRRLDVSAEEAFEAGKEFAKTLDA
jgi:hypothetical protein